MGCSNGLLFDANECLILRDTHSSLGADAIADDGRVRTDRVLARVCASGRMIEQRVLDWLQAMATSWNITLPADGDAAAPFTMDVVPAVSGSYVREVA